MPIICKFYCMPIYMYVLLTNPITAQVPAEPDYEEAMERFIKEEIPVFGLIGKKCVIRPDAMYDIDDDARLVYDYLQAYRSGRINSLYNPGTEDKLA